MSQQRGTFLDDANVSTTTPSIWWFIADKGRAFSLAFRLFKYSFPHPYFSYKFVLEKTKIYFFDISILYIYWQTFPLAYILMTRKTIEAYHSAFNFLKEEIPLNPSALMSDFEAAIQSSCEIVFPGIQVHGCLFHYCQVT